MRITVVTQPVEASVHVEGNVSPEVVKADLDVVLRSALSDDLLKEAKHVFEQMSSLYRMAYVTVHGESYSATFDGACCVVLSGAC